MKTSCLVFLVLSIFVTIDSRAQGAQQSELSTTLMPAKDASRKTFDWGSLIIYFSGESRSASDVLTAVAIINPGMQIHPPHSHSEEEYLMVQEGEGTWTVKGKQFPAVAGDVLYAAPWDEHGIVNTGDTPLSIFFFKWNSKSVEPMQ